MAKEISMSGELGEVTKQLLSVVWVSDLWLVTLYLSTRRSEELCCLLV
jgi:hypothetical protein